MTTQLGTDVFLKNHLHLVQNKRVALLTHVGAVNGEFQYTHVLLHNHPRIHLTLLFSPEHGIYGIAQDMESVSSATDPLTGLPVVSLYGTRPESLKPKPEHLDQFDVLVCDLQDVGTRYYTYVYTLAHCLEACGKTQKKVIVLDRPNPLGGVAVEGNLLKSDFASFVGMYPLPVRHGMTIGELARYFNDTQKFGCELEVIPMNGWRREMTFDQTGLVWSPPSPNMPTLETAFVYPGMCLIEATEISEGRGTTRPFEWVGAPFIHAGTLANELNRLSLNGVTFRPIHFIPNFQKHAGEECAGVHVQVTDRNTFKPYETGLHLIKTIHQLYLDQFKWRMDPYEFVADTLAIDLLTGCDTFRNCLEKNAPLADWMSSWNDELKKFKEIRKEHLLYPLELSTKDR